MKLSNGNTLMKAETFTEVLGTIKGRFDSYQSAAEYALVHWFDHGDKMKLERLMKAFVGASGKIIGDGRLLASYVNQYCYGFKIEADGRVTVEKKKNGKPKPRGFKGYNDAGDLSWKAGGYHLGFADSITAFQKAAEARKVEKRAEAEAKAAEAEALAEQAKAAKAEAKAANADSDESEAEEAAPDYGRASDIAEALRSIRDAFAAGSTMDVEALAEAKAEAEELAKALADRMAEAAQAEVLAADQDSAAEADAMPEAAEA